MLGCEIEQIDQKIFLIKHPSKKQIFVPIGEFYNISDDEKESQSQTKSPIEVDTKTLIFRVNKIVELQSWIKVLEEIISKTNEQGRPELVIPRCPNDSRTGFIIIAIIIIIL